MLGERFAAGIRRKSIGQSPSGRHGWSRPFAIDRKRQVTVSQDGDYLTKSKADMVQSPWRQAQDEQFSLRPRPPSHCRLVIHFKSYQCIFGRCRADLGEEFREILTGELSFEGLPSGLPTALKIQQALGNGIEAGAVIGR